MLPLKFSRVPMLLLLLPLLLFCGCASEIVNKDLQPAADEIDDITLEEAEIKWQGGTYSGSLKDGIPEGYGVWHGGEGASYEGQWQHGLFHGEGQYRSPEESNYRDCFTYRGDFAEGKREGAGVISWDSGAEYSGDFKNNKIHGTGTLIHTDGSVYSGDFIDHKMKGFWTSLSSAGLRDIEDARAAPEVLFNANFPLLINPQYHHDNSYWSLFESEAYWHYQGTRVGLMMPISEIIELLGRPLSVENVYGQDYDGPGAGDQLFDFGFMEIIASETWTSMMQTASSQVYGPRNICVGDSYALFTSKFPAENNNLEPFTCPRGLFDEVGGETVHYERVLYGSKEKHMPFGSILYNSNKEPLLSLFYDRHYQFYEASFDEGVLLVFFQNSQVKSFRFNKG